LTFYSPGVKYLCQKCGSNQVFFIFDNNFRGIDEATSLIKTKQVVLSDSYADYTSNTTAPKWLCYGCYDCGVVLF